MSDYLYSSELIDKICSIENIIIYGAGIMGKALKMCLEAAPYNKKIECFLVKDIIGNPKIIDGIPVKSISDCNYYKEREIIVALNEKNMSSAILDLESAGFARYIELGANSEEWSYIKGEYFYTNPDKCYVPYIPIECVENNNNLTRNIKPIVYVAKSIFDKKISSFCSNNSFEKYIQVGAALADKVIADVCDDYGDNISTENRIYCELTALYWIWKNEQAEYVGLEHYRRRFDISENMLIDVLEQDVDVIVTIPVINTDGIGESYSRVHSRSDWEMLKNSVSKQYPEYINSFNYVEKQNYFFPYNMCIMKKTVLNRYCEWLFPILKELRDLIGDKEDVYQNRYTGFMAERLLNIFLYHNRKKLKIVVSKKKFLN